MTHGGKGQTGKARQLSHKKCIRREEQFGPGHCTAAGVLQTYLFFGIWLWSLICCENERRVTASDLIPSRTVLGWWGPRVQALCWPSVDKLLCCWGESQWCLQPEVIWLLRNGCRWAAALQLLFPWLCSRKSPRLLQSVSKIENHPLDLKKKKKSTDNYLESWQQFALNGRDGAGGAVFGNFGPWWDLHSEDSAKCLNRWMDSIIPDRQAEGILGEKTLKGLCLCMPMLQIKHNPGPLWHHQWSWAAVLYSTSTHPLTIVRRSVTLTLIKLCK